jgi:hypothetical protein
VLAGVVALVLVPVAGGCTRTVDAAPSAPATIQQRWSGCDALGAFDRPYEDAKLNGSGSVPAGFEAVAAISCEHSQQTTAGGDVVGVAVERVASDVDALLSYLRRPSQTSSAPGRTVCPAMAWVRPWLFLRDQSGRWVMPTIPTDECGFPLDQFTAAGPAYAALTYRDTVIRRTGLRESARARRSGCAMQWKDMVAVHTTPGALKPAKIRSDPFAGQRLRLCTYAVPKALRDSETPVGDFVRGRTLSPQQRRALVGALVGSPAARACTEPTRRFAVLQPLDGSEPGYVELDGCRRILVVIEGHTSVAQASGAVVRLLTR